MLAVNPAIHRHVATLIASTTSDDLRRAADAFLQRYSHDAGLVGSIARPGVADAPELDPFFSPLPSLPKRLSKPAVSAPLTAMIDRFWTVFGRDGRQAALVDAIQ
jgi:hypothetical protein